MRICFFFFIFLWLCSVFYVFFYDVDVQFSHQRIRGRKFSIFCAVCKPIIIYPIYIVSRECFLCLSVSSVGIYPTECCQWCILSFSFPLILVDVWWWLFLLLFRRRRSLQVSRRFYIFLFCSLMYFVRQIISHSQRSWLLWSFVLAPLLSFCYLWCQCQNIWKWWSGQRFYFIPPICRASVCWRSRETEFFEQIWTFYSFLLSIRTWLGVFVDCRTINSLIHYRIK